MISGRTKTYPLIKGIFLLKGELYVTKAVKLKEHFNLYYIFEEDKQKNALNEKTAADIWKRVCAKVQIEHNGLSPPPSS